MPAPPLTNTYEGGTNATTITIGNSGGASGNAFQLISGACTFSNLFVMHGSLAMRCAEPATFGVTRVLWSGLGTLTIPVYFRWYWRQPSLQTVGNMQVLRILTNAGTQSTFLGQNATTGMLRFFNAAGSGIAATLGTVAPNVASYCRLEARVVSSTTVGEVEWRLYNTPEAAVGSWTDRGTATGQVLGADSGQVEFGLANAGPTNVDYYYDSLAVSVTDWIGPMTGGSSTIGAVPHRMPMGV